MLYIIGIGLHSYKDITLQGLEYVKKSKKVFLENYTSIQQEDINELEGIIDKKIIPADRNTIEIDDTVIIEAKKCDVSLLVSSTPLFATTHLDIVTRAQEESIDCIVVHNASILNVYGCLGLYSYNFGKTVSIPYFTPKDKPTSFYNNIYTNFKTGLHTLCLLDIKTDENRFMTANAAIEQLLESGKISNNNFIDKDTRLFVICRVGSPDELKMFDTAENLLTFDFGKPLHSLVIPSCMDTIEKEFVEKVFKK